ncbi:hypothetical protein [Marivita sp. GX14005]|nr:hypothetical protein [Marivita sp. GX14005]
MMKRIKTFHDMTGTRAGLVQDALGALSLVVMLVGALHLPVLV